MPVIWITALFVAIALLIKGLLPRSAAVSPEDETEDQWIDRQW
jgi:hypothetical protein